MGKRCIISQKKRIADIWNKAQLNTVIPEYFLFGCACRRKKIYPESDLVIFLNVEKLNIQLAKLPAVPHEFPSPCGRETATAIRTSVAIARLGAGLSVRVIQKVQFVYDYLSTASYRLSPA
jgi:hypothetical protein